MTKIIEDSTNTNQGVILRKGLSTIARRQTGSFNSTGELNVAIAENIASPKEIGKQKCHVPSMLAL